MCVLVRSPRVKRKLSVENVNTERSFRGGEVFLARGRLERGWVLSREIETARVGGWVEKRRIHEWHGTWQFTRSVATELLHRAYLRRVEVNRGAKLTRLTGTFTCTASLSVQK